MLQGWVKSVAEVFGQGHYTFKQPLKCNLIILILLACTVDSLYQQKQTVS